MAMQIANAYPEDIIPSDIPQEQAVSVKGWKPKKQGWLGAIADAYLMSQGMKPAYKERIDRNNMMAAMEGFTNDPLEAVRKIAQIPGMQDKAWTLYNTIVDNQRGQGALDRQNRALDMRNDDYIYQQTAGMMGAARPDTWQKMRELAIQRGASRGVDVSAYIPEEYDPDSIEYIRYGAVKPKDQMTLEERRRNNEARTGIQRDRLNETIRNNDLRDEDRDTAEEGRNNRGNKRNKLGGGQRGDGERYAPAETDIVRPGEQLQIQRQNGKIIAARVLRKDRYDRQIPVMLSPAALNELKKRLGQ